MKRLLMLMIGLLASLNAWGVDLTATLDRYKIHQMETVQLTLHLQGYHFSSEPDLKPLMQDFAILGSAKSSQLSFINGQTKRRIEWQITLAPRHAGTLTIPSLSIGKLHTPPLKLQVTQSSVQFKKNDSVFIEVQAQPKQLFVQSQVLYTVRLYIAEPLQGGTLTDPIAANTIMLRIGNDNHYQTIQGGRHYEVIERRYAILPQKSGAMTISAPTFMGQRLVRDQRDPLFPQLRPLRLTSQPITLKVQDKPTPIASEHWLPAQHLTINESWSLPPEHWQVGEPITRTITLSAVGLSGEQLPDLSQQKVAGFNIYPAPPKILTTANEQAVLGQRVIKLTYIPTKTGTTLIPAVNLPWWHTLSQQSRLLSLPEQHVIIAASNNSHTDLSTASTAITTVPTTAKSKGKSMKDYWPWLVAGVVTSAWLATLILGWRRQRQAVPHYQPVRETTLIAAIKAASLQNNPQATNTALLAWARHHWPQQSIRCLADIIASVPSAELKHSLAELDNRLYSAAHLPWDGAAFWSIFMHTIKTDSDPVKIQINSLPPLYPQ